MVVRPPVLSSALVSTTAEMEQGAAIDTELRGLQFGCSNPTSVTALVHAEEFFVFPDFRVFVFLTLPASLPDSRASGVCNSSGHLC